MEKLCVCVFSPRISPYVRDLHHVIFFFSEVLDTSENRDQTEA